MQDAEQINSELLELKYPWRVDRVWLDSQKKVVEVSSSRMKRVQSFPVLTAGMSGWSMISSETESGEIWTA